MSDINEYECLSATCVGSIHKIKNGSKLYIGRDYQKLEIIVAHHFNKFQKYMIKRCFGFEVEDYTEE